MAALDTLANEAWEAVMTAHAVLLKEFEAEDMWSNLSLREYDVLYTLSKCEGPIRMGELGQSVLLSQPGLSRLVDRLVQRGLVRRTPDPADRRGVRVSLTDAGAARQKEVGRLHARSVRRALTSVLDPDELRQLKTLAGKLAGPGRGEPQRDPRAGVDARQELTRSTPDRWNGEQTA